MRIGIHSHYECYNQNNILFEKNAYRIGDNLEYPFVLLRDKLNEIGVTLDTLDMYPLETFDKVIFLDVPNILNSTFQKLISQKHTKLYLVIFESEIILKSNWKIENHRHFEKIFTWCDGLVDNKMYFKYYWPNILNKKEGFNSYKSKFCVMIAGNKMNNDKRELYSERLRVIEWFEKNHKLDFDLFGFGWDNLYSNNKVVNKILHIKFIQKHIHKKRISYRGSVIRKDDILKDYKFSICFENAKEIEGYITEKIFDCFVSGSIPIYLGAPNIDDFIPRDTYIDMNQFNSYSELYEFLKELPEIKYEKYISSIDLFLNSQAGKLFSVDNFVRIIISEVLNELK